MDRLYHNKKKMEGNSILDEIHNPASSEIIQAYNYNI